MPTKNKSARPLSRLLETKPADRKIIAEINGEVKAAMDKIRLKTLNANGVPMSWGTLIEGLIGERDAKGTFESFILAQIPKFRACMPPARAQLQTRLQTEFYEIYMETGKNLSKKLGFQVPHFAMLEILLRDELAKQGVTLKT